MKHGTRARVRGAMCAAALLLGACSSEDSDRGADAADISSTATPSTDVAEVSCSSDATPGTVKLWHSLSGSVTLDALDSLAAGMLTATGLTVEFRRFESDNDLVEAMAVASTNEQPDLVLVTEQVTRVLLDSQQFLSPSACVPALVADLYPQVTAPYSFQGELAAVPFGVSAPVLVFDAQRLRAAGLDPDAPPRTLAELLAASAAVRDSGVSDHGLVTSDSCAITLVQHYSAQRGVLLGSDDNGHTGRLQSVDLVSPEIVADLTALRDAAWDEHVKYIGANPSGFDDLVTMTMPTDSAVMAVHTSAAVGEIISLLDNGNFANLELGVAPLPGPGVGSLIGGNALWVRDTADAARVARAWKALEWLTAPEQLAELDAATGYAPPTRSAAVESVLLDAWRAHPQMRVAFDQILTTEVSAATAALMVGPYENVATVFYRLCDRIMDHGADVEMALQEATENINLLIADYESAVAGTPPPSTTTTVVPPAVETVQGRVRCESGAEVVGIWVDVRKGGSGWANRRVGPLGWTEFSIDIDPTSDYQLHVGCGGTEETWATAYFSKYVTGEYLAFDCADGTGKYHGWCDVVSV